MNIEFFRREQFPKIHQKSGNNLHQIKALSIETHTKSSDAPIKDLRRITHAHVFADLRTKSLIQRTIKRSTTTSQSLDT